MYRKVSRTATKPHTTNATRFLGFSPMQVRNQNQFFIGLAQSSGIFPGLFFWARMLPDRRLRRNSSGPPLKLRPKVMGMNMQSHWDSSPQPIGEPQFSLKQQKNPGIGANQTQGELIDVPGWGETVTEKPPPSIFMGCVSPRGHPKNC